MSALAPRGAICPRCSSKSPTRWAQLFPTLAGDAHVRRCGGCGGVWVPHSAAPGLRSAFPDASRVDPATLARIREAASRRNLSEGVRYLRCPDCSELMERRPFALGSAIVIDRCRAHGVWFDAGELELARAYFEAGGPAADASKRERARPRAPTGAPIPEVAAHELAQLLLELLR